MDGLDAAALAELDRRRHGPTWHWATPSCPRSSPSTACATASARSSPPAPTSASVARRRRIKVTAVAYGGANLTWSLPALIGESHARDLILTGRAVDGPEAYRHRPAQPLRGRRRRARDGSGAGLQVAAHPAPGTAPGQATAQRAAGASRARPASSASTPSNGSRCSTARARHLRRLPRPIRRAPCGPRARSASCAEPSTPRRGKRQRRGAVERAESAADGERDHQRASAAPVVIWPASTSGPRTR